MKTKREKQLEAQYRQARHDRDDAVRALNGMPPMKENKRQKGLYESLLEQMTTNDMKMRHLNELMIKDGIQPMVYRPVEELKHVVYDARHVANLKSSQEAVERWAQEVLCSTS